MKILEPISLGTMRLRNRFVMSPMISNFATVDGYVTQRMKDYYAARAEGGAAMIIVEATCVEACGRVAGRQLMIDDDTHVAGLKELASAIRKHGAKACISLRQGDLLRDHGLPAYRTLRDTLSG
jgi:2,4-dienoyl-CoA reductase-like NADH-dependent reductase (Old Yellow Enzyme family)